MPGDIVKFAKHLRAHALSQYGQGLCGQYVRKALQAGGATMSQPYLKTGKEYGPMLLRLGFHPITVDDPATYNVMSGDVMVMQPRKGSTAGHIAGFDGKNWIADFIQVDFWAGPQYRTEKPWRSQKPSATPFAVRCCHAKNLQAFDHPGARRCHDHARRPVLHPVHC